MSSAGEQILHRLQALMTRLDASRGRIALFIALLLASLLLLFPTGWHPNEENYFLLSLRRVAPEAFSPLHASFDSSDGRILYEYLLGWLTAWLGYDTAYIVSRLTGALALAAGLSVLARGIGLSVLESLAAIALFVVGRQHFFGHEWLFMGVEAKVFAYALVAAALGLRLQGRHLAPILLMVVATYVHFLIGGFWALALVFLGALQGAGRPQLIKLLGLYVLLVGPLLALLFVEQFAGVAAEASIDTNAIYALRNAHHVAPFAESLPVLDWLPRIFVAAASIPVFLVLLRWAPDPPIIMFVIALLGYLFVALLISYLDRHTYYLAKLYLFRPSSLTLLLAIMAGLAVIGANLDGVWRLVRLGVLMAMVVVGPIVWLFDASARSQDLEEFSGLHDAIVDNSDPGEIVLVVAKKEALQPWVGLPRKLPRPTLVSRKFVPTLPSEIARWQHLLDVRDAYATGNCPRAAEYPIRLLLFDVRVMPEGLSDCGQEVWSSRQAVLVRLPAY